MARPTFFGISGRVTELGAIDEGAVTASAPATSRLFVLPVATRRWVSTDNRFWHTRWDSWWVLEPQEQMQRNRHGWQSMLPGRVLNPRPQEFLVWSRSVQY